MSDFPVGSIIVRERLSSLDGSPPTDVIAMVKREAGFSKDTGDWEFLVLNGDLTLKSRETVGNCSACHTNAQKTDWVFLDQLKK